MSKMNLAIAMEIVIPQTGNAQMGISTNKVILITSNDPMEFNTIVDGDDEMVNILEGPIDQILDFTDDLFKVRENKHHVELDFGHVKVKFS